MTRPVVLTFPKHSSYDRFVSAPLPIFSLGSYMQKYGYEDTEYFDERIQPMGDFRALLKKEPLLVGVSALTSYQIKSALNIAKLTKEHNPAIPVVWGGVHPTMMPEQTAESPYCDFIVRNEGEQTMLELVQALEQGKTDFSDIKGLTWKQGKQIISNPERPFMDFNDIPFVYEHPSREIINRYVKLKGTISRQPLIYQTTRGCPYGCRFCFVAFYYKRRWRIRKPELIEAELQRIMDFGVDSTFFVDDNIGPSKKHLLSVCDITQRLGLKWGTDIRVDHLSDDIMEPLVKGNCEYLLFGLESGSNDMLKYIDKSSTIATWKKGIDLMAKTHITGMYSFIFGFPKETADHRTSTFEMIDYIRAHHKESTILVQIFTPFAGTPMYQECIEAGFKPPQTLEAWADYVMDEVNTPWVKGKDRSFLRNIYLVSGLAFRTDLQDKWLYTIPRSIARWRWKHRFFDFCVERTAYDVMKKLPFFG